MAPKAGKQALDDKMQAFRDMIKAKGISSPDMKLVQSFFSTNELKALWGRFTTARGKSDVSVQEAWDELCGSRGSGGKDAKGRINTAKDEVDTSHSNIKNTKS